MARPSKLTPETQASIVKAIGIGVDYKTAAGAAGIDYDTFNNWMKQGASEKKGKFFEFFVLVTRAKHEALLKYAGVIAKAANDGDWRAALEYLKRHDPENWGDKQQNINIDYNTLSDSQLARIASGESVISVLTTKS